MISTTCIAAAPGRDVCRMAPIHTGNPACQSRLETSTRSTPPAVYSLLELVRTAEGKGAAPAMQSGLTREALALAMSFWSSAVLIALQGIQSGRMLLASPLPPSSSANEVVVDEFAAGAQGRVTAPAPNEAAQQLEFPLCRNGLPLGDLDFHPGMFRRRKAFSMARSATVGIGVLRRVWLETVRRRPRGSRRRASLFHKVPFRG